MIDRINRTQKVHIVTVEDPIEFVHEDHEALINQRELDVDTLSFAHALKYVLRQDPDVILVGEMRDLETIHLAITAAETGHLVFATSTPWTRCRRWTASWTSSRSTSSSRCGCSSR